MTETAERRQGPDRRRQPRGGRRPTDRPGFAPLVYVIDPRPSGLATCEAILAKLRFAVAPFASVEQARRAMPGLVPDIVLVTAEQLEALRRDAPTDANGKPLPILPIPEEGQPPLSIIEDIRRALRASR